MSSNINTFMLITKLSLKPSIKGNLRKISSALKSIHLLTERQRSEMHGLYLKKVVRELKSI